MLHRRTQVALVVAAILVGPSRLWSSTQSPYKYFEFPIVGPLPEALNFIVP